KRGRRCGASSGRHRYRLGRSAGVASCGGNSDGSWRKRAMEDVDPGPFMAAGIPKLIPILRAGTMPAIRKCYGLPASEQLARLVRCLDALVERLLGGGLGLGL